MAAHAVLSASSAHRWLACPPSARLCAWAEEEPSEFALQGTDAHSLCEYKLQKYLGSRMRNPANKLKFYDQEMEECADAYLDYVSTIIETAKRSGNCPCVLIEQKLDFSRFVPEGFGTGDCVIIERNTLHIVDYKHGKGVEVSAVQNPQMLCYALGAAEMFGCLYDIQTVSMTIFQPRLSNVSKYTISMNELIDWAENTLRPAAELAYKGEGDFKAGDHCRFCKVKATCRKRMEYNMELAKYDFEVPELLTDEEISILLGRVDELVSWAGAIKEHALQQALCGKKYDGFKVVEGRSSRKYSDDVQVAEAVEKAGYDPYEKKLLGVTAMTALLGRTKFDEILSGFIIKPPGKPTLVPENDKREEMNIVANDFEEEK